MDITNFSTDNAFWAEFMNGFSTGLNVNPLSSALSLISYILLALGLYAVAKRRGINHAWLAWIPIGNSWLLGCISDQYRYIARREEKNKRKTLLILEILTAVACITMIVFLVVMFVNLFDSGILEMADDPSFAALSGLVSSAGWVILFAFVTLGLAIATAVVKFMAFYDLFSSCDPNNKTLYLVLGIFFDILLAIFVYISRKKDLGMPPRRDTVQQEPPMWIPPQQEIPRDEPPAWNSHPPVEPWDQNRE